MAMKCALIGSVMGLSVLTGFASSAIAQTARGTRRVQNPFRIKAGAFFLSDGDVRDSVGDVSFSYGLSYDIAKSNAEHPITYSAYLDGATKSH